MKKVFALTLVLTIAAVLNTPAFAAEKGFASSDEAESSVQRGADNVAYGWTEFMERTHQEASKGTNAGEQVVGLVAGSAIGIRKGIHRIGAGAIDLLTFWIPKDQPLITPEDPPVH